MMEKEFIKAVSVFNKHNFVYARQCFHEPGMLKGFYLIRMPDGIQCIPDSGWIVWHASIGPYYDIMTDEEFRNVFVLYSDLSQELKDFCNEQPNYNGWVTQMANAV